MQVKLRTLCREVLTELGSSPFRVFTISPVAALSEVIGFIVNSTFCCGGANVHVTFQRVRVVMLHLDIGLRAHVSHNSKLRRFGIVAYALLGLFATAIALAVA